MKRITQAELDALGVRWVHRDEMKQRRTASVKRVWQERKKWTPERVQLLRELIEKYSHKEIARQLGETVTAVRSACTAHHVVLGRKSRFWTDERNDFLTNNYADTLNSILAEQLNTNEGVVQRQAMKLKLRKSDAFRREQTMKSAFKKGHVPSNKGKDCKHWMTDASRATQFKKGQQPVNTKKDGDLAIRKNYKRGTQYRVIRVGVNKWVAYARHLWEQAHGKIPKGTAVAHINGDSLDDRLENLELISRKELALRSSASLSLSDGYVAYTIATRKTPELKETILNYPELIELKREELKLRREIKKQLDYDNTDD